MTKMFSEPPNTLANCNFRYRKEIQDGAGDFRTIKRLFQNIGLNMISEEPKKIN